jgi:hypothetical protein
VAAASKDGGKLGTRRHPSRRALRALLIRNRTIVGAALVVAPKPLGAHKGRPYAREAVHPRQVGNAGWRLRMTGKSQRLQTRPNKQRRNHSFGAICSIAGHRTL